MTNAPNKSLGQHWLHDNASLIAMCDIVDVSEDDTVLEIGPGLGTLTAKLVKRAKKVIAVEFDKDLAKTLHKKVQAPNLEVVHNDILSFDLTKLPKGYKVVANVPYYITSKIVRVLLESTNPPESVALLVQKEVAERMAAEPGEMSILSISAQFYASVSLGRVVPARLFTPPPQVDSQIICLDFHGQIYPDVTTSEFFQVVRAGFSERRKKLRSSLSGGLRLDKPAIDDLLIRANIPADARAQELSLDDWHQLTIAARS